METFSVNEINNILKEKYHGLDLQSYSLAKGNFIYYHYGMQGISDQGWGCGYRTIQTICSWIKVSSSPCLLDCSLPDVPMIRQIQELLIKCGDKEVEFVGSKDWIGTFEACLVVDVLFDVPCKIVHFQTDSVNGLTSLLQDHFQKWGSPVMIGGNVDCSSKGVFGIATDKELGDCFLLVDPHYNDDENSLNTIIDEEWIKWLPMSSLCESSFYNVCLPQIKAIDL